MTINQLYKVPILRPSVKLILTFNPEVRRGVIKNLFAYPVINYPKMEAFFKRSWIHHFFTTKCALIPRQHQKNTIPVTFPYMLSNGTQGYPDDGEHGECIARNNQMGVAIGYASLWQHPCRFPKIRALQRCCPLPHTKACSLIHN